MLLIELALRRMHEPAPRSRDVTQAQDGNAAQTFFLTFCSDRLERAFWDSGPVRRNLMLVDQVSGAVLIFNNICIRVALLRLDDAAAPVLLQQQIFWAAICISVSLLCNTLVSFDSGWYYKHRTKFMTLLRVLCIVTMYVYARVMSDMDGQHILEKGAVMRSASLAGTAALGAPAGTPALGIWFLLKALLLRSLVVITWMICALFPLPFAHNCVFAVLIQPVLLVGTATTAAVFRQAPFLAAACRVHDVMRMVVLDTGKRPLAPGECPAFAPSLVAYSFWLVFGLFGPLAALRAIESRYRKSFLALFTFQRSRQVCDARPGISAAMNVAFFVALTVGTVNVVYYILASLDGQDWSK